MREIAADTRHRLQQRGVTVGARLWPQAGSSIAMQITSLLASHHQASERAARKQVDDRENHPAMISNLAGRRGEIE
jgi:hypothetical protein